MISDVDAFRAAWQAASAVVVDEKPNATVQAALDRLAEGVVARLAHGSTLTAALASFHGVVKRGSGTTSDPAGLDARAFSDGDRWLVCVRMGFAASVVAFGPKGRLTVPPDLRWSYRQFGPFFRAGGLVAFDNESLQDAGVRFSTRLAFLRRTPQGYASAGVAKGTWSYGNDDAVRLALDGARVTLLTLDPPRSFFVSSPERLLRRREIWDASGKVAKRIESEPLDPDVRAADDWLWAHRGKGGVPRELGMLGRDRREKGMVELAFDDVTVRFDLALVSGRNVVRKASIR